MNSTSIQPILCAADFVENNYECLFDMLFSGTTLVQKRVTSIFNSESFWSTFWGSQKRSQSAVQSVHAHPPGCPHKCRFRSMLPRASQKGTNAEKVNLETVSKPQYWHIFFAFWQNAAACSRVLLSFAKIEQQSHPCRLDGCIVCLLTSSFWLAGQYVPL